MSFIFGDIIALCSLLFLINKVYANCFQTWLLLCDLYSVCGLVVAVLCPRVGRGVAGGMQRSHLWSSVRKDGCGGFSYSSGEDIRPLLWVFISLFKHTQKINLSIVEICLRIDYFKFILFFCGRTCRSYFMGVGSNDFRGTAPPL